MPITKLLILFIAATNPYKLLWGAKNSTSWPQIFGMFWFTGCFFHERLFYDGHMTCLIPMLTVCSTLTQSMWRTQLVKTWNCMHIITFDDNYLSKSRCARTSFLRAPMVKLIWLHVSTLTFILHFLGGCHLSGFFRYKNGFWGLLTKVEGTLREITAWLIYVKTTSYLQIFCHQKLQCQMIP